MALLLQQHDVLIHPSYYEGLPNVVCEALAAAMPVLISKVCDHPLLVADKVRGFNFEPGDPLSMAKAIEKITTLNEVQWQALCLNARKYAEDNLSIDRMVRAYENLSIELLQRGGNQDEFAS